MVRTIVQALCSILIFGLLVLLVRRQNVFANLRAIPIHVVIEAIALLVLAYTLNSRRWQMLLRNVGIHERLANLTGLYFIGQFWTLFLPTGAGGDALRAYEVARRSDRPTVALLATLQERVFGLGASLIVGLVATFFYLPLVPRALHVWAFVLQGAGIAGVVLLLYPSLLTPLVRRVGRYAIRIGSVRRAVNHPIAARVLKTMQTILELPPISLRQSFVLTSMAIVAVLMGVAKFYLFGVALGVSVGFMAYCLVIPLVWIARMIPFSLGGLGVGEGAFVLLMGLFGVPSERALAIALAAVGAQLICALMGGVLLFSRTARRTWRTMHATSAPIRVPHAANGSVQDITSAREVENAE